MGPLVRYELRERVARSTLAAGDRGNPLNQPMVDDLARAVHRAGADDVHVVVISADGPAFSFGGDVSAFAAAGNTEQPQPQRSPKSRPAPERTRPAPRQPLSFRATPLCTPFAPVPQRERISGCSGGAGEGALECAGRHGRKPGEAGDDTGPLEQAAVAAQPG